MTIEMWNKTSVFKRGLASVCRLLAPLLIVLMGNE